MSPSFEQITTFSTSFYKAELFLPIPAILGAGTPPTSELPGVSLLNRMCRNLSLGY
jgi:hypothetical protein